jgi:hypothetical protein
MGASVQLIRDESLRVVNDGYAFEVRLNWYRSLPLSSVEILSVKLDGEQVPLDQILFEINNHHYSQAELLEQFEEFWFVQDCAVLHIRQPGKVNVGETHDIEAEISLRFPYMNIGPGKFLTNITRFTSTQVVR